MPIGVIFRILFTAAIAGGLLFLLLYLIEHNQPA